MDLVRYVPIIPFLAVILTGCSHDENHAPVLYELADQLAFANNELRVTLRAGDENGDDLIFAYQVADIDGLSNQPAIAKTSRSTAEFRWIPTLADVGLHPIDLSVEDGQLTVKQTIVIEVRAGEGSTKPVFVQPLNAGSALDLGTQKCLDIPIAIDDQDSLGVVITQAHGPTGATLIQHDEFTATWTFCPTAEQAAAEDRFTVAFAADDGVNPSTVKHFLVVLVRHDKGACPGHPPVITHAPQDVATVFDLTLTALVSDDIGLKYEPLLYYSKTEPSSPPDIAQMVQTSMVLVDGDEKNGTWSATVPNPVASDPEGSTSPLYYLIRARDDDDAVSNCYHEIQMPPTDTYQLTVTNVGGQVGFDLCTPCSADVQCGDQDDYCLFMTGGHYCFKSCASNADCPNGYYCSFTEFISIDDAQSHQCIPDDYQCGGATAACAEDAFEDNDSILEANASPVLPPGSYSELKHCPAKPAGVDEDWYHLEVTDRSQIEASINGGSATDLDLSLVDASGKVIVKSDGIGSAEAISACVDPGRYFLRIYAWAAGENSYELSYQQSPCVEGCQDDGNEDDDDANHARVVDLFSQSQYESSGNTICSWDDDWYGVHLFTGETLHVSLTFQHTQPDEDLDLLVYYGGANLTGCSETDPGQCDPNNGQSVDSNETLQWHAASDGTYYVVVHGWGGAENDYDIAISLAP